MDRPSPDLLSDYLECINLLEKLLRKKEQIGDWSLREEKNNPESGAIMKTVDDAIVRAKQLVAIYDEELEVSLQSVADEAEAGVALFLSVSRSIAEIEAWTSADWDAFSPEERERWRELLADYAKIREAWLRNLPPEEGPAQ